MLTHFCPIAVLLGALLCVPPAADPGKDEVKNPDETEVLKPDPDAYKPEKTPELPQSAERIVVLTNELRVEKKLPKLKVDPKLEKTAAAFAEYMAKTSRYGHTADGKDPGERVKEQKYEPCLVDENIAYAFRSRGFATEQLAREFFAGWKASPGHLKNMLDPDVTETAVAICEGAGGGGYFFAVQLFGRPISAAIGFQLTNDAGVEFEYELGGETFKLLPRQTRTHQACRPKHLAFVWHDADNEEQTVTPAPDDHFAVTREGESFQVRKK